MESRRIEVIGGGPAGLFAARLLALDHPDWTITLHERLPPDDTFGFGVGLTGGLLKALQSADQPLYDAVTAAAFPFAGAAFELPAGTVELSQFHSGAIGRAKLLRILTEHAQAAGVDVRIGNTVQIDDVRADADLVIAADGVSSPTRDQLAGELGVSDECGRGLFIWCGSATPLRRTVFFPVETDDGLFVAHSYPYQEHGSTFVIETDVESVERAGCRQAAFAGDADSDDLALEYLSAAFTELLDGGAFVGNKSRWMHFRTIHCDAWHHENVVLLGDAKATAHPSLGSGTKLALEDAIGLAEALRGDAAPASALDAFEAARRADVERIQDRAHRSQLWWESFGSRLPVLSPARVAVAYLSRSGAVSLDQLLASNPDLAAQAVGEWAQLDPAEIPCEDLTTWILDGRVLDPSSNGVPVLEVDFEDPWSAEADGLLGQARKVAAGGAEAVQLDGDASRGGLLDRLAFGERVRNEVGLSVDVVSGPDQLSDVADGIVAGRTDRVVVRGG
jgi:anthraniloyl-CoA monooxygenase